MKWFSDHNITKHNESFFLSRPTDSTIIGRFIGGRWTPLSQGLSFLIIGYSMGNKEDPDPNIPHNLRPFLFWNSFTFFLYCDVLSRFTNKRLFYLQQSFSPCVCLWMHRDPWSTNCRTILSTSSPSSSTSATLPQVWREKGGEWGHIF